jgi:hypothetical protein
MATTGARHCLTLARSPPNCRQNCVGGGEVRAVPTGRACAIIGQHHVEWCWHRDSGGLRVDCWHPLLRQCRWWAPGNPTARSNAAQHLLTSRQSLRFAAGPVGIVPNRDRPVV